MATRANHLRNLGARFYSGWRQSIKFSRGVCNHVGASDKLLARERNFAAVCSQVVPAWSFSTSNVQYSQVQAWQKFQVSKEELISFAEKIGWPLSSNELLINALTHKSYVMTDKNDVLGISLEHNERLGYLGYQTASSFITEILYLKYPALTTEQLWDLQNGLLRKDLLEDCGRKIGLHNLIFSKDEINSHIIAEALLAIIGSMYIDQPPNFARVFVESYLIQDLAEESVKEICQLEHPKLMLKKLSPGVTFSAKILEEHLGHNVSSVETEGYKVGIFQQGEMISEGSGDSQLRAEKNACQNLLKDVYLSELKRAKFPLEYSDYTSEDEINFGLLHEGIRVVEIDKGERGFGFSVKGGEMRSEENKEFLKYNYYFPPFVVSVVTGDPAERCGLRAGDVILAINDKSTKGMSHHKVVNLLHSLKGKAKFTVKHSKKVLIGDEIERKFGQFREKKLMSQLADPKWSKWHHSHLKKNRTEHNTMLKRHSGQDTSPR